MEIIDPSREIYHRTATHPSHSPVVKTVWNVHDLPGLAIASVHGLADKGIGMFGVEAVSPSPEGELNFQAQRACAGRRSTRIEPMANLDKLVGRGRFRFVGVPLRIRGGTASPIRAVAIVE